MSDDLVKQLREVSFEKRQEAWGRLDGGQDLSIGAMLAEEAADRIEELHNEWRMNADGWSNALIRIEELEAKLAAAVESLRVIEDASGFFARNRAASDTETLSYAHETTRRLCVTTLAELKGTDQ